MLHPEFEPGLIGGASTMPELKNKKKNPEYIFDKVTLKIVDTLLDNPSIPYNKNQLAEAADISRDALYRRWDVLLEYSILKKSEVGSSGDYWELDQNSDTVEAIARILHSE